MIKHCLWAFVLLALAVGAGCKHRNLASNGCSQCSNRGDQCCRRGGRGGGAQYDPHYSMHGTRPPHAGRPPRVGQVPMQEARGPLGPLSPTYAYPYYTLRGPRDFLVDNPPSIGR